MRQTPPRYDKLIGDSRSIGNIVGEAFKFSGRAYADQQLLLIGARDLSDEAFVGLCFFMRDEITYKGITASCPIDSQGLRAAAIEMAVFSRVGLVFEDDGSDVAAHDDAPCSFLIAVWDPDAMILAARASELAAKAVGRAEGSDLVFPNQASIPVTKLIKSAKPPPGRRPPPLNPPPEDYPEDPA